MHYLSKGASEWKAAYRRMSAVDRQLSMPAETLVRLFKGGYIPGMPKSYAGLKVCDVSCGSGNNAFFLCELGLDVYCTEIHEDICKQVAEVASLADRKLDLRVGTNRELPFEPNFFDFLVSWNVLHYEDTEARIVEGISEYARILKPGGRIMISTTGPEHKILRGAETIGHHVYEISREDDFRKGERFFYFDAPNYLRYYFKDRFTDLMIGRIHDHLFTETLDWWILTGIKTAD